MSNANSCLDFIAAKHDFPESLSTSNLDSHFYQVIVFLLDLMWAQNGTNSNMKQLRFLSSSPPMKVDINGVARTENGINKSDSKVKGHK